MWACVRATHRNPFRSTTIAQSLCAVCCSGCEVWVAQHNCALVRGSVQSDLWPEPWISWPTSPSPCRCDGLSYVYVAFALSRDLVQVCLPQTEMFNTQRREGVVFARRQ